MALVYLDSFDHYQTADFLEKWSSLGGSMSISPTAGRHLSAGLVVPTGTNWMRRLLNPPDKTTCIVGFSLQRTTGPSYTGICDLIIASGQRQATLSLTDSGTLIVQRGFYQYGGAPLEPDGTTIAYGTTALSTGATYHIEWRIVFHDTVGETEVRINGVPDPGLSAVGGGPLTGLDTEHYAGVGWAGIQFGNHSGPTFHIDDLYVLDGSGATPVSPANLNTFLGDCRVDTRVPKDPTPTPPHVQWTPLIGSNWQCVDDLPGPNDDNDYTYATAVGLTDTHVMEDLPVVGSTVYGIQHCINVKKSDAGVCIVAPVIRHGTIEYPGPNFSPMVNYMFLTRIAEKQQGSVGPAWTEAAFNAAEFGYRRIS